ncbi:MAG: NAD(P)/FAD-dependent oxidoreductase [Minisyncoccia bacterium]
MDYDLIIIGGGPGGVAAGIYAARKKIKTAIVTDLFGGQSVVSNEIKNWVGEKLISGFELSQKLEDHLRDQEGIEIDDGDLVTEVQDITKNGSPFFKVITKNNKEFNTKTILITSGSRHRKLNIPGEDKFEGKGVFYCSSCDAPLLKNKKVAVIGGGNAGLEAVRDLLPYANQIYLLEHSDLLKGDLVTQELIKNNAKVKILLNAQAQEIIGENFVTALKYLDKKENQQKVLEIDGIFVEIGQTPNSDFVKNLVELNQYNEIVVDCTNQRTSKLGIWAAGDVTNVLYKQNNISVGDAIKAVLNIYDYLNTNSANKI